MEQGYSYIRYHSIPLEVPCFLKSLWPYDFPLDQWPTFCGAGSGLGDMIVPDHIFGVQIAPACFIHDIDWSYLPNTEEAFHSSNFRLFNNLKAIIDTILSPPESHIAHVVCADYYVAVSTVGKEFFKKDPADQVTVTNPLNHLVVQEKLSRLQAVVNRSLKHDD